MHSQDGLVEIGDDPRDLTNSLRADQGEERASKGKLLSYFCAVCLALFVFCLIWGSDDLVADLFVIFRDV